jgi:excinuclease ABC subunit C
MKPRGKEVTPEQLARLEELKEEIKKFPTHPGVYIMRDAEGTVIYIGKAKSLKSRVRTYFGAGDGRSQIQFLMRRIHDVENIVTASEEQAFVLERALISKHKPRYNIRLKDDKAYLSIRLDDNARWPRLQLVRRVEQDGARYYGPYTFSYEVRTLLDIVNKTIPLRTCPDTVLYNRQRPCLEYQIKRCSAPCCLPVDVDEYADWVKDARQVLEGKVEGVVKRLTKTMDICAESLEFERAADIRDKIEILQNFAKGQQYISPGAEHRDVFAVYREERLVTLSILTVRYGRISDNKNFSFRDVEVPTSEVIEDAIEQFYRGGREVPEEVIVAELPEETEFLISELSRRRGKKVSITEPQRGIKFRLLKLAEVNAQQHFATTFDAESRYLEVASILAQTAKLEQVPRRIECVDISNFQGTEIVGAVVSFFDGKPDKQNYKRYILSEQGKPDDFTSMYEVVSRRLARGKQENSLPDLLIIDGGKGQLGAAIKARDELEVPLKIIALAKERSRDAKGAERSTPERLFLEGQAEAIPLASDAELTKLVTRVRDEVHRFVIEFHRKRRLKRGMKSVLDDISGVGPERKRRLFKEFGSIAKMKQASSEELARAGRMPKSLAEKVLRTLQKK